MFLARGYKRPLHLLAFVWHSNICFDVFIIAMMNTNTWGQLGLHYTQGLFKWQTKRQKQIRRVKNAFILSLTGFKYKLRLSL